jgi:hypothetical protein
MEQVLNLPASASPTAFFSLGGHSLLGAKLTARLNKELDVNLPLRTVFESSTAGALASSIEAARQSSAPKRARVTPRAEQGAAPLTVMQERIRFVEEMFPGRVTYNTPSAHRLRGTMDVAAFERAFNEVVKRQPGLRTFIARQDDAWIQARAAAARRADSGRGSLHGAGRGTRAALTKRLRALVDEPMDIYTPPLFRTALFRMDKDYHVFFFMPHHIVWDGWSFDLLYQEMSAAYGAALRGKPSPLAPLAVTYADYAHWHAEWMKGDEFSSQLAFWKKRFANIETPRALPTDHPRRPGMTGSGEVEWVHIDQDAGPWPAPGRAQVRRHHQHAHHGVVRRHAFRGRRQQVRRRRHAGSRAPHGRGRAHHGLLQQHAAYPPGYRRGPAADRLGAVRVKRELLEVFANQDVPFERLAAEPEFSCVLAEGGFLPGLFSFQDARERQRDWGGLAQENLKVMQAARRRLRPLAHGRAGGLEGGVNFNADLFTRDTAVMFRKRILGLLRGRRGESDIRLRDLLAAPPITSANSRPGATPATRRRRRSRAPRRPHEKRLPAPTSPRPKTRSPGSGRDCSASMPRRLP